MTSTADYKELLFIVGMHRSGTSAMCAALAACGASFGEQLIDPMAGVNDEGFWEDANVVALNEQLLALAGSTWYAPAPDLLATDWTDDLYKQLREQAAVVLQAGFGGAGLQAVKDPRLCLTLPFWLGLCDELRLATRVCVISRAPLEVARSLEKRDGFPVAYGLRLFAAYRSGINRFAPADALQVGYEELLQNTPAVMTRLAEVLPLNAVDRALDTVVRLELRHQSTAEPGDILATADVGELSDRQLLEAIEARFPANDALREFARNFTNRGLELSRIGAEHTAALATLDQRDSDIAALSREHRQALATLDERDADIAGLSAEHQHALATINERDEQIREFDRRLSALGEEHSHALEIVRERDAQLALIRQRVDSLYRIPGVGLVIRRLWKNAQG